MREYSFKEDYGSSAAGDSGHCGKGDAGSRMDADRGCGRSLPAHARRPHGVPAADITDNLHVSFAHPAATAVIQVHQPPGGVDRVMPHCLRTGRVAPGRGGRGGHRGEVGLDYEVCSAEG